MKKLLMGNEAIALGAMHGGVKVFTGYPGTPSTEVLETVAKTNKDEVYAEWSTNEKSALEVAAGAAISGVSSMVTMKQVGLNVASDPLMSLNYVGVKGAMVVYVADDPGPISSQTEQDTRHFGRFAKFVVFDPATPEEAYTMVKDAAALSKKIGRPVIFRSTTRICHGYASVDIADESFGGDWHGSFSKDGGRWVIFPRLAYNNHLKIEDMLEQLSDEFASYPGNELSGSGKVGFASGGVSWQYLNEALADNQSDYKKLKIGTYPLPEKLALDFLSGLEQVLVAEELDPVIEDELLRICGKYNLNVKICGKRTGNVPRAGELSSQILKTSISAFLGNAQTNNTPTDKLSEIKDKIPVRPPVLCAGCPHRASFFAVKDAIKGRKATFSGDIGCYTLGNAQPLDMVDTCLCMGAGITQAQGLCITEPDVLHFAFVGDSTFFHTGIPNLINAVYNNHNIILCILDNSTTAMTGGQPHPGIAKTLMGKPAKNMSIEAIVQAIGVDSLESVNAFDLNECRSAVNRAAANLGVNVIIFKGLCINLLKERSTCKVDEAVCTSCGLCVRKLGCPALSLNGKNRQAVIDESLCTGCGLCAQVCGFKAVLKENLS
ncbi:MAG: indolepyruvate ferredoxin oxidoreductase subunit alpha [Oscillospiraceae bacterium]|jgi:indolepyruvate ferredoxin oxidoreductase alpha subunit|nr:indolepyruvate ferredoxin oxidoreductase subunit alpha [Oscillospiraceae bacterium]